MESFATPYPLFFFDGEQEHNKGFVSIHPELTFKRFQFQVSQKTGIPPNQLSAVFVCRSGLKGSEKQQRFPINGTSNFNTLLNQYKPIKERDCYFLVSTKRSKKERKGSRKRVAESELPGEGEFGAVNGVEVHGHPFVLDDVILEGSLHSTLTAEDNASSMTGSGTVLKHFMDNGVDSNRAMENRANRVILKRGHGPNASFLPRHGRNHRDFQHARESLAEEYAQLHSPRFAALRPEDQRDLSLKWKESFQRVKARGQWESHAAYTFPYNVGSHTDVDYHQDFSGPFLADRMDNTSMRMRKGRLADPIYNHHVFLNGVSEDRGAHNLHGNRESLQLNYLQPSFQATRRASPLSAPELPWVHDPFFERHSLLEGDWLKMPGATGGFGETQAQDAMTNDIWANEEAMLQSLSCQLCFECKSRGVLPIPFHWCVEDAVTNGFRGPSPAGPIGRRAKMLHIEPTAA